MKLSITLIILLLTTLGRSQGILNPVTITVDIPKKTFREGEIVEIVFKASIQKGWYLYTLAFDSACGPTLFEVRLKKDSSFELVGSLFAVNDQVIQDKLLNCDLNVFETTGEFRQKIKVVSPFVNLAGTYEGIAGEKPNCTTWVLFSGDLNVSSVKK